jgi:outer membrane receptor protein involved in Fe transport
VRLINNPQVAEPPGSTMRLMFSVVALLLVAALAMYLAKKQLQAVTSLGPAAAASAAPGSPAGSPAQPLPQRVQQDVQRALEQGAARASAAEP